MNVDDNDDGKGFDDANDLIPTPPIEEIKASRVCFYLGRWHGRRPKLDDFVEAVPFLEDCNTLIFAEPRRSRVKVRERVDWHKANLSIPIPGGFICEIDTESTGDAPGVDYRHLFVPPAIKCVPTEAMPVESRFWLERARFTLEMNQGNRDVNLYHIGIGGLAAWVYFFQPHGIKPVRIIGSW